MHKTKNITSNLAFRLIFAVVLTLMLFSCIVSALGYVRFTKSLTAEYNDSAFRTAETAATLVNADHIDMYLETGGSSEEYAESLKNAKEILDELLTEWEQMGYHFGVLEDFIS